MSFTMYTTNTCGFCHQLKNFLNGKGVKYDVIDVTEDTEKRQELQSKYNALTVPILVRADGEYMVGMNMPKLMSMI